MGCNETYQATNQRATIAGAKVNRFLVTSTSWLHRVIVAQWKPLETFRIGKTTDKELQVVDSQCGAIETSRIDSRSNLIQAPRLYML